MFDFKKAFLFLALVGSAYAADNDLYNIEIKVGYPDGVFSYTSHCSVFYLEKINDYWMPKIQADISKPEVERFNGCITMKNLGDKKQFKFNASLDTDGSCGRARGVGANNRTDRYYKCHSNFAKLNIFGGGYNHDDPIDFEKIKDAVNTPEMKEYASNFFKKANAKLLELHIEEGDYISFKKLMDLKDYLNPDFYRKIAVDYLEKESLVKINGHSHIHLALSEEEIENINKENKAKAYAAYKKEANFIFSGNPSVEDVKKFQRFKSLEKSDKWTQVDFENLVPKTEGVLQNIAFREQQKLNKSLEPFRKSLVVGSNTHCGVVVGVNGPMILLALNTLLPGYSNQAWIRRNDAFPPEYGCINKNGHLTTYH